MRSSTRIPHCSAIATWLLPLVTLGAAGCADAPVDEPPAACTDSAEPNAGRATAFRIQPGLIEGLRACPGDEDWYVIRIEVGQVLRLGASATTGPERLRATVHEAKNGATIAELATGAAGLGVDVQPGDAGDYFVRVTAGPGDALDYRLSATIEASSQACGAGTHPQNGACVDDGCSDLGLEPNDSVATARRIHAGTYAGLAICQAGDKDYYAIHAPAGGAAITLSLYAGSDLDLYVTDGQVVQGKARILASSKSPDSEEHVTQLPIADGQILYVLIQGEGATTGEYDLVVDLAPLDPVRDCLRDCGELVPMDGPYDPSEPEAIVAGYYIGTREEYAFVRRDLGMRLQWAFAQVAMKWPGTAPVYLSDICQDDGKTPGTDAGQPRHPTTTHVRGRDADVAYFQTLADNDYRIICGDGTDTNGNGRKGRFNDGYFCTSKENVVDIPRQTYFVAMIMGHPMFRVLGIDETLPDLFVAQVDRFVESGELPRWAAWRMYRGLAWGNEGGWAFHHHHIHISLFDMP